MVYVSEGLNSILPTPGSDCGRVAFHLHIPLCSPSSQKFPGEFTTFKFPAKRLVGNFDPSVIQARQKGLQDFIQAVLLSPRMSEDEVVRRFLLHSSHHVS